MANYANLKTAIQQYIKQNGNEEITGAILQTTLLSMVDSLASGHLFKGIASPMFAPATTDGPTFYIALEAGSYINFTLTELGATAILREGYFGIFKTSGGSSNWTFTEVAISIKDGIVTTSKIANGAVTTDKIANGAVDTAKIAEHTIRWENMDQGAVDEDILQDNSVSENKIKDGAVTEYKLGTNTVSTRSIKNGAVTDTKIYPKSVTMPKLGEDVIEKLDKKANIDGSYESMSVGMAKNVEGTSPISGIFTFRPTAGDADVADGVARVLKIGGNATPWNQLYNSAVPTAVNNHKYFCREYNSGVERSEIVLAANLASWFTDGSVNRNVIDLTLMFGAGNEPSSVAEFKTRLQNNIGLQTYYPYNAGKLLVAKLLGLKTVGFNQWDEEWEVGAYNYNTGEKQNRTNSIRCKNLIKVLPNTSYFGYFGSLIGQSSTNSIMFFYDANKNYISYTGCNNVLVLTPNNCSYVSFYCIGTTYNHDICINLHYTNGRDGEYEPYEEHNYNFDTSKVYGKLNGEGNLVQIFPNGMRSAKNVFDEINFSTATAYKRVGNVDLGSLDWFVDYDIWCVSSNITDKDATENNSNGLCSKFPVHGVKSWNNSFPDNTISVGSGNQKVTFRSGNNTTAADVKSLMSGVDLFYQLAEPLEYTDLVYRDNGVDTPIDALNILVSNYGTEEQIVESPTNGDTNSCAATLDILYGVNAADFMDSANNGAFVSKASMDSFLNTLGNAMNGVWSAVWNNSTGKYDFSFTPNAALQNENLNND